MGQILQSEAFLHRAPDSYLWVLAAEDFSFDVWKNCKKRKEKHSVTHGITDIHTPTNEIAHIHTPTHEITHNHTPTHEITNSHTHTHSHLISTNTDTSLVSTHIYNRHQSLASASPGPPYSSLCLACKFNYYFKLSSLCLRFLWRPSHAYDT